MKDIQLFNDSFQNYKSYQSVIASTGLSFIVTSCQSSTITAAWYSTASIGDMTPKVHQTQKPVPLLERIIEIFTDKGDVVIDPCAGSGTTLLAAGEHEAQGIRI